MTFATFSPDITLHNDRISHEDAHRQTRAARELLARLAHQPGVILADEVGMGKTFVALATAVSILSARPDEGPVVVMSPPSLRHKWPKDWKVFLDKCVAPASQVRWRAREANSGVEFLKLLDDPEATRAHVIFLTHGALDRAMGDGFVKLAVIKRAFRGRSSLASQREAFGRWASRILWLDPVERRAPGLLGRLLDKPCERWLRTIQRADARLRKDIIDDPVPRHLADVLEAMDSRELEPLVAALRDVPLRESAHLDERLSDVRRALVREMKIVWRTALRRVCFRSPLLVLDEAHHVKNPATKLASLFMTEESAADSSYVSDGGPLAGKFARMIFLTATPFQLGHGELIRVLERFESIAWDGPTAPSMTRDAFRTAIASLGRVMDDAQSAALRLDSAWNRLTPDGDSELWTPDDVERWWESAQGVRGEGILAQVVEQVRRTREAMAAAEGWLAPWVLRHVRPGSLPDCADIPRRQTLPGAAILGNGDGHRGLEIAPDVLLPFLLAGRAQGLLAASTKGRALFAEGLASSFEAYLETRAGMHAVDEDGDMAAAGTLREPPSELDWYLRHLDRALPRNSRDIRSAHPKVRATAARAVELWRAGEKVLIFCHYRATGRALRQHISTLLHREIVSLAQRKLPRHSAEAIDQRLHELGEKFFDGKELSAHVTDWLTALVRPFAFPDGDEPQVIEVLRRFLRTPSFLARYFPLDADDLAEAFTGTVRARHGHESLQERLEGFCRFLVERCIAEERREFLDALQKVQTGTHSGKDVRAAFDVAEGIGDEEDSMELLPNVRLANGEVRADTRRRLLLTFNTPLFPEILIASSVLAEGVDLHLHCRHVIHHDLSWNPSTLEQRSGRVDRIGCRAERVRQPIALFLPYLAATQDEKMYRVVRDRERWFQIVMGERYETDEAATDRRARRIPLPVAVQQQLCLRLHPQGAPAAPSPSGGWNTEADASS